MENKKISLIIPMYYEEEVVEQCYNRVKTVLDGLDNYDYEIIRLCTKSNTLIVGGTNRLLKRVIQELNAYSIISYVSIDKFTGDGYSKIGFELTSISNPGYVWSNSRGTKIVSRYMSQKKELIKQGFGTETDKEDDIMRDLSYLKIYNAGNFVYTLSIPNKN